MQIESPYANATSYLMIATSVIMLEIFAVDDLDLMNGPRSNVNTPLKGQMRLSVPTIAIFVLSVTVCDIYILIVHDLDPDIRMGQGQM